MSVRLKILLSCLITEEMDDMVCVEKKKRCLSNNNIFGYDRERNIRRRRHIRGEVHGTMAIPIVGL
jgi:hypothetical protein